MYGYQKKDAAFRGRGFLSAPVSAQAQTDDKDFKTPHTHEHYANGRHKERWTKRLRRENQETHIHLDALSRHYGQSGQYGQTEAATICWALRLVQRSFFGSFGSLRN